MGVVRDIMMYVNSDIIIDVVMSMIRHVNSDIIMGVDSGILKV